MKLAPALALPVALSLLFAPRRDGPPEERWTRLGHRDVLLTHRAIDPDAPIEEWFPWAPLSVQAAIHSFRNPAQPPRRLSFGYLTSGLEIYVYAAPWHPEASINEGWYLFLRDPSTDSVSPTPIGFDNEWILKERPRVRMVDLDGDGRDELAFRQFFHNGTANNDDVEIYVEILPDLGLRGVFIHEPKIYDDIHPKGARYVYSELWQSNLGRLQSRTWREAPDAQFAPEHYGTATLVREPESCYEIIEVELTPASHVGKYPGSDYVTGSCEANAYGFRPYLQACGERPRVK